MPYTEVQEFALANIVRVEVETEEAVPKQYRLTDVATDAEVTAYVSEGKKEELRVKNTIKAQNDMEDIVKGYDIKLISATMIAELLALVDGGTLRYTGEEPNQELAGYDAPVIGVPVKRTLFTLHVYTEEKDADGTTMSYVKFTYKHCKGKPVNYIQKDGSFFVPEFLAASRPKQGESPVSIDFLKELPA